MGLTQSQCVATRIVPINNTTESVWYFHMTVLAVSLHLCLFSKQCAALPYQWNLRQLKQKYTRVYMWYSHENVKNHNPMLLNNSRNIKTKEKTSTTEMSDENTDELFQGVTAYVTPKQLLYLVLWVFTSPLHLWSLPAKLELTQSQDLFLAGFRHFSESDPAQVLG